VRPMRWLPAALWPLGLAAVVTGFVLLFRGDDDVTLVAIVGRSVGGSFLICGLIAWQRRPSNRSGMLMTATGFLYLAEPLLGEIGTPFWDSMAQLLANLWAVPFAALILSFPSGRVVGRVDRGIVWGFAIGTGLLQLAWLLFLAFPEGQENIFLISAEPGLDDVIDTFQRAWNGTLAAALGVVGLTRWLRAAPALRRLLLPTLAGSAAALILAVQILYQVVVGGFIRASAEITSVVLVSVPLAYLFGLLRTTFARAGVADLVLALQQAPDAPRLRELLARALHDPSLELVYWLPGFESYIDATGQPVPLPAAGSGRAATPIDQGGEHVAALVHDAALAYDPELLALVSAAANVALERERLQAELQSRIDELAGSRARLVEAGDAARRKLERDLHDGAQQRLVTLAIQLRMTEDRVHSDPDTALKFVSAAREEVSKSLEELRELARGIHPAVLQYGLDAGLTSLAVRSATPVALSFEVDERLPEPVELAAYFVACEALANIGKYAQATRAAIRVSTNGDVASIEITDDGVGGADGANGSGLRGLADRVEALGGRLRVISPAGGGTTLVAELPCQVRPASV
jgi:signal transduction histidine kinase